MRGFLAAVLAAILLAGTPSLAIRQAGQAPAGTSQRDSVRQKHLDAQQRTEELHERATAAIEAGDYVVAEELLREQIALNPNSFVPYYNLACVLSLAGDAPGSIEHLVAAIKRGFVDIHHLRRDPQLDGVRDEPEYRRLIEGWPEVLDAHLEANLAQAQRTVDGRAAQYETHHDERLRVAWLSAMDGVSFEAARADIARLYDWGSANIFTELQDAEKNQYDAWVLIVLPSPRDFLRWAIVNFGPDSVTGNTGVGGIYDHDLRRLIAQDLGPTLRHEFFHVLHWRSMTRRGQMHPIWIQEGLCSLVEEYELHGEQIRPVPSWRTNIVRRLNNSGRLQPLRRLAAMPREHFTGNTALANYAQARAFFMFMHDAGKLGAWYAAYTDGFDADPTGLEAVERVFGQPLDEIELAYRDWIRNLPKVAEQIRPGAATLGVDVDPGAGDGPVIVGIPRERSAALRNAGLRRGDVITAINGRPTRDLNELVRILGEYEAGDEVEVAYRRGTVHDTARVSLIPR